ncbi:gibberellin-regulated protein 14-like [Penaeus japonicus]|uniref:gibberellin-regulated protein 14-like n=1 Tax=Penaeus japonicus TaxID=27405 RepID=UPI001C70EB99|nr:gibberellin-regulated protein 14-like [Penaeus japonicus]
MLIRDITVTLTIPPPAPEPPTERPVPFSAKSAIQGRQQMVKRAGSGTNKDPVTAPESPAGSFLAWPHVLSHSIPAVPFASDPASYKPCETPASQPTSYKPCESPASQPTSCKPCETPASQPTSYKPCETPASQPTSCYVYGYILRPGYTDG